MATLHLIKHKWREEMVVPYLGISNNISFLTERGEKQICTADNISASVEAFNEVHVCAMEELIQRLYGMSAWDFMCRWYNSGARFDSANFVYIKSKRIDVQQGV